MPDFSPQATLNWFTLYVRVCHERKVEPQLANNGFDTRRTQPYTILELRDHIHRCAPPEVQVR
jgi:hypothetical protein